MGVSGTGKTTVGHLLAAELGWDFADGDDYHPAANVEKMRSGIPLTDADREPWLKALREQIAAWIDAGKNAVLACSALKRAYRDRLRISPELRLVYLRGTPELLRQRLHRHRLQPAQSRDRPSERYRTVLAISAQQVIRDEQLRKG